MSDVHPVGRLYDRLLGSEADKVAGNDLTIHKRLRPLPAWEAEGITDINDWLRLHLSLPPTGRLLDAGCGVGGSLLALLGERRTGVGVSLSPLQIARARQLAADHGVADRCTFIQQSYDEPLPGKFDLVLSIEALIHAADLAQSINHLCRHLRPGGQLVIVEDMATRPLTDHPVAAVFRQSWCLYQLYTDLDYREGLQRAGMRIVQEENFTPQVRSRPWPGWLVRALSRLSGRLPHQRALDIFAGGFALEHLYRQHHVAYRLLRAVAE